MNAQHNLTDQRVYQNDVEKKETNLKLYLYFPRPSKNKNLNFTH